MPQGNQTGPMGQGSRTGRQLGYCSGYDSPGYTNGFGRGKRRGMGNQRSRGMRFFGRGFTRDFFQMPSMNRNDELTMLRSQANDLKRSQEAIQKRMDELEKESD